MRTRTEDRPPPTGEHADQARIDHQVHTRTPESVRTSLISTRDMRATAEMAGCRSWVLDEAERRASQTGSTLIGGTGPRQVCQSDESRPEW